MATENLTLRIDEKGALVVSRKIDQIGKSATGSGGALQLLKRALGFLAVGTVVKQLAGMADSFTDVQNRLKLVTTGTENLSAVTDELFAIAGRTRSSFEATAESYSKFALSAKELGYSQRELLDFTETLNKAVILGGSSATEAAGGMRQLAQGIASGALRGDELISVLENLPFVADTIAKQLGVTRGELRKMGAEGKITADDVILAFQNQKDSIEEQYKKTLPTLSQAFGQVRNSVIKLVGDFDQAYKVSGTVAKVILEMAGTMNDQLRPALDFIADVGVATFNALEPIVVSIAAKFNEWGVNGESLKMTLNDIGLALVALLRTATQIVDGIISAFNILGKVIATAIFGGMQDAEHYWNTGWHSMKEFFRGILNDVIYQLNNLLAGVGIDKQIEYIFGSAPPTTEAFNWGKGMGDAVAEGFITPTTDLLDNIIQQVEDAQLKRQLEGLRDTLPAGGAISTDRGKAPPSTQERAGAAIIAARVKELERERTLLGLTNLERERQAELWKLQDELVKAGATQAEAEAMAQQTDILMRGNQELALRSQVISDAIGPTQQYQDQIRILNELIEEGGPNAALYQKHLKELKSQMEKTANDPNVLRLGDVFASVFDTATNSLVEFTQTGRFLIKDFVSDILAQLARMAASKAFGALGGSLGLPGFATGGSFTVGGEPGVDKNVVAFRATRGEQVTITPPGGQAPTMSVPSVAAPTVNVNIVNVVDPSMAVEALESAEGEGAVLNVITRNSGTVRQAIAR